MKIVYVSRIRLLTLLNRIVDWDTATYVPLPAVVHFPLFIADIPGYNNDIPSGMTFEDDRAYLESTIYRARLSGTSSGVNGTKKVAGPWRWTSVTGRTHKFTYNPRNHCL